MSLLAVLIHLIAYLMNRSINTFKSNNFTRDKSQTRPSNPSMHQRDTPPKMKEFMIVNIIQSIAELTPDDL